MFWSRNEKIIFSYALLSGGLATQNIYYYYRQLLKYIIDRSSYLNPVCPKFISKSKYFEFSSFYMFTQGVISYKISLNGHIIYHIVQDIETVYWTLLILHVRACGKNG